MRRIYAYSFSLVFVLWYSIGHIKAQDTINFPLKIKLGIEVYGPAIYYFDKNVLNTEGFISADLNEKVSLIIAGGSLKYRYSQYNYEYLDKGIFGRIGTDINFLKPDKALGKYWVGVGLHYGISRFTSEVPSFQTINYWGTSISSVGPKTDWAHFFEVSPGVRAEMFRNFSIGWTISLRMLLHSGTGNDLRSIYFPGFGNGANKFSPGISYFLVWNIPFKKINVIMKKEVPEEPEDTEQPGNTQQTNVNPQP